MEPWERQLFLLEMFLLAGHYTNISSRHNNSRAGGSSSNSGYSNPKRSGSLLRSLAYAWGKEKGYATGLLANICGKRGDIEQRKAPQSATGGEASMSHGNQKATGSSGSSNTPAMGSTRKRKTPIVGNEVPLSH